MSGSSEALGAAGWAFYLFAAIVLGAALSTLFRARVVAAAQSLFVGWVALTGIAVLLEAHWVAVFAILAAAGAMIFLFLFVARPLPGSHEALPDSRQIGAKLLAATAVGIAAVLLLRAIPGSLPGWGALPEGFGRYGTVGRALHTDFVLPFELLALLLLGALVGAVVLVKRRVE